MIRNKRPRSAFTLGLTLGMLLSGAAGLAQDREKEASPVTVFVRSESGSQGTYRFVSSNASFNLKTVKGAPYSADAVTTSTQILPDGNRIFRESSALVARDSEGRTRQEMALPTIGTWVPEKGSQKQILIHDPVERVSYTLNPETQIARKSAIPIVVDASDLDGEKNVFVTSDDKTLTWRQRSDEGDGTQSVFVVRRIPEGIKVEGNAGKEIETTEIHITATDHKVHAGSKDAEGAKEQPHANVQFFSSAAGAGPHVLHFDSRSEMGESRTEDLGTKTIEGVLVEGTRTTRTIEAGVLGNELPIEISSERWYSPDLQIVVMTRQYDPRMGETVFQLKNLSRSEPDPGLFEVPADYKIESDEDFSFGALHRQRQPD